MLYNCIYMYIRLKRAGFLKINPGNSLGVSMLSHWYNRLAYSTGWKKAARCTGGSITGPKHCPVALMSCNWFTLTRIHRNTERIHCILCIHLAACCFFMHLTALMHLQNSFPNASSCIYFSCSHAHGI